MVSIFFIIFGNYSFYANVINIYPLVGINLLYIASLTTVLFFFIVFLLTLFSSRYTIKPLLITTLIVSAFTSYFMNSYHVVIDADMIRNTLQTDMKESLDLLSFQLLITLFFLGILPSYLVYKSNIHYNSFKQEMITKIKVIFLSLLIIIITIISLSKFYTSFFREHKPLRYYTNPTYWIYSVGNYINQIFNAEPTIVKPLGRDAKIISVENKPHKLVIMVVGEAVRADHFSLNGYERETNPLIKKENIINFSNLYSCGTSTAHSVPCMFSKFNRDDYSYRKGISNENILDILNHTDKVSILWRDNNSDSKGMALRVPYFDYKHSGTNTMCQEGECRDEGLLVGLDEYIAKNRGKDIFIVLHQMGNHGPAYYKRYPKEFEQFTPVCQTNQLENCSQESIKNAYDNTLLYTDYFLSKTIALLKQHHTSHDTTMIYMSDHGESLGENGLYLHGLPYFMAPDAQTHVASFIWRGENQKQTNINKEYSHDNLFHTLLGLFQVQTKVYDKNMDILKDIK